MSMWYSLLRSAAAAIVEGSQICAKAFVLFMSVSLFIGVQFSELQCRNSEL